MQSQAPALVPQDVAKPVQPEKEQLAKPPVAAPVAKGSESSEEVEDKEDAEMDQEAVEKELKRRIAKKREAELINQYNAKLRDTTIENFVDRPDQINSIRILNCTTTSVEFEWDQPCANNSIIQGYSVYLNDELLAEGMLELFYVLEDLQPKTCYRLLVVATSDQGEGYKNK